MALLIDVDTLKLLFDSGKFVVDCLWTVDTIQWNAFPSPVSPAASGLSGVGHGCSCDLWVVVYFISSSRGEQAFYSFTNLPTAISPFLNSTRNKYMPLAKLLTSISGVLVLA